MRRFQILSAGCLGGMLLLCATIAVARNDGADTKRYVHEGTGAEFLYPSSWSTYDLHSPNVTAAWTPEATHPNPIVILTIPEKASANAQLPFAAVETGMIDAIKRSIPDAKISETKEVIVDGQVAHRITIDGHAGEAKREMRIITYLCLRGPQAYSISITGTLESLKKHLGDFETMISTVRLAK